MAAAPQRRKLDIPLFADMLDTAHNEANAVSSVVTELVNNGGNAVIFKATVTTKRGTFVGHGSASTADGPNVSGRWLELGETRAIKRALLVACNIKAGEHQDEPRPQQRRPAPQPAGQPGPLNRAQADAISKLLGGVADAELTSWLLVRTGKRSVDQITSADGAAIIQELQRRDQQ